MAYEHKPGSFTLFKNNKKSADNHPDYTGTGKDRDGSDIDVSAWIKESGNGGKFMSCVMKEKWVKPVSNDVADPGDFDNESEPF
jgi:hypothetical protein